MILIGFLSDKVRVRKPFMVVGAVGGIVMLIVSLLQAGHHTGYYTLAGIAAALSFFLGPMGWLYAAPLKETLPAIFVYLVLMSILPHSLFMLLLGVFAPLSAVAGTLYAWRHNQRGERTSLLDFGRSQLPPRR